MPTYSYACTACGHRFDAQQSFDDAALTQCPECAGRLRKLFGAVGVVFKGSGFYRTDSRSSGSKNGSGGSKTPKATPSAAPAAAATTGSGTTGTSGGGTGKAAAASA